MLSLKSLLLYWWVRSVVLLSSVGYIQGAEHDGNSVGKMRSAADVFFTNGQLDQAVDMWSKVIMLEPSNDANFYKRFRVYLRQQKLKEALADLNTVLKLNPKNEGALVQRAKLNLRLGKCEDSEKDFFDIRK